MTSKKGRYKSANFDPSIYSPGAVPRPDYRGTHVNGIELTWGTGRNYAKVQQMKTQNFVSASKYPQSDFWGRDWIDHNLIKDAPKDLLTYMKICGNMDNVILLPCESLNVVVALTNHPITTSTATSAHGGQDVANSEWDARRNFFALTTQPIWQTAPAYFIPVVVRCLESAIRSVVSSAQSYDKPLDLQDLCVKGREIWQLTQEDWEAFTANEFMKQGPSKCTGYS